MSVASNVVGDLVRTRHFIRHVFLTSLRNESRQTLFGFAWSLLPALAIAFVICVAAGDQIVTADGERWPYAAYVLAGVFIWQAFLEGVQAPIRTIAASQHYLSRLSCAPESLFASRLLELALPLLLRLVVAMAAIRLLGVAIGWRSFLALVPLILLTLWAFSLGMLTAPFCVLYRDMQQIATYATIVLFAVTPVAYVAPRDGPLAVVVHWNPLVPLVRSARLCLRGVIPPLDAAFVVTTVVGMLLFVVSWIYFRVSYPIVAERQSV